MILQFKNPNGRNYYRIDGFEKIKTAEQLKKSLSLLSNEEGFIDKVLSDTSILKISSSDNNTENGDEIIAKDVLQSFNGIEQLKIENIVGTLPKGINENGKIPYFKGVTLYGASMPYYTGDTIGHNVESNLEKMAIGNTDSRNINKTPYYKIQVEPKLRKSNINNSEKVKLTAKKMGADAKGFDKLGAAGKIILENSSSSEESSSSFDIMNVVLATINKIAEQNSSTKVIKSITKLLNPVLNKNSGTRPEYIDPISNTVNNIVNFVPESIGKLQKLGVSITPEVLNQLLLNQADMVRSFGYQVPNMAGNISNNKNNLSKQVAEQQAMAYPSEVKKQNEINFDEYQKRLNEVKNSIAEKDGQGVVKDGAIKTSGQPIVGEASSTQSEASNISAGKNKKSAGIEIDPIIDAVNFGLRKTAKPFKKNLLQRTIGNHPIITGIVGGAAAIVGVTGLTLVTGGVGALTIPSILAAFTASMGVALPVGATIAGVGALTGAVKAISKMGRLRTLSHAFDFCDKRFKSKESKLNRQLSRAKSLDTVMANKNNILDNANISSRQREKIEKQIKKCELQREKLSNKANKNLNKAQKWQTLAQNVGQLEAQKEGKYKKSTAWNGMLNKYAKMIKTGQVSRANAYLNLHKDANLQQAYNEMMGNAKNSGVHSAEMATNAKNIGESYKDILKTFKATPNKGNEEIQEKAIKKDVQKAIKEKLKQEASNEKLKQEAGKRAEKIAKTEQSKSKISEEIAKDIEKKLETEHNAELSKHNAELSNKLKETIKENAKRAFEKAGGLKDKVVDNVKKVYNESTEVKNEAERLEQIKRDNISYVEELEIPSENKEKILDTISRGGFDGVSIEQYSEATGRMDREKQEAVLMAISQAGDDISSRNAIYEAVANGTFESMMGLDNGNSGIDRSGNL